MCIRERNEQQSSKKRPTDSKTYLPRCYDGIDGSPLCTIFYDRCTAQSSSLHQNNEAQTTMALIKFGGGVAGISGKIGGTVFARNKAGAYARNWAKPVNPVTPSQSNVRAIFGNGSASWSALTSAERDQWNSEAALQQRINRFGEVYTPSGRQYYLEVFNSTAQAGFAAPTTPTVAAVPPLAIELPVITATLTGAAITALTLAFTDPVLLGDQVYIIEAAPIQPDSRTNVNTQYRQIMVSLPVPASPLNILAAFTALFGTAASLGDLVRLRVTSLDTLTGLRSAQVLVVGKVA